MNLQILISKHFWQSYKKFFLVGLTILVLLLGSFQLLTGKLIEKGPQLSYAWYDEEGNWYEDEEESQTPIYDDFVPLDQTGQTPIDDNNPSSEQTPIEQNYTPEDQTGQTPIDFPNDRPIANPQTTGQVTTPVCNEQPDEYDECYACNTSRHVKKDTCGRYTITNSSQNDPACSNWCAPTEQPQNCQWVSKDPECTWERPGEVREVEQNTCTGEFRYPRVLQQSGVCGDTPQTCQWTRLNPECTWRVPGEVREVEQNTCTGEYRYPRILFQPNVCGDVQPTPQPNPTFTPFPTFQPTPFPTFQPTPFPTVPPQQPQAPFCDPNQVSMNAIPNPVLDGNQITFNVNGSQGSTWIDDFWTGGVTCSGGFFGSKTCTAVTPGTYTWTHFWRNTAPNNFNITSDLCQKSISFTVNPRPVVTPPPPPVQRPVCDPNQVVMSVVPNPSRVGDNVSFNAFPTTSGHQNIDDFFTGGVSCPDGSSSQTNCRAVSAGTFSWTHFWRVVDVNNPSLVSDLCSKSVNFSVSQVVVTPTPTPFPTVVPTPFPTVTPAPVVNNTVTSTLKCPAGTVQTIENNTIICIQNVNNNVNTVTNTVTQAPPTVITVAGATPTPVPTVVPTATPAVLSTTSQPVVQQVVQPKVVEVAGVQVQELPKTGLPLAGWLLGALLPAGIRLRRFGNSKGIFSPNTLWEKRQFKM